jgi:HAD superfamily hydrolase (TIGR01509 family)
MTPELVIFDCDGVLVDSEVLSCRAVLDCLAGAGIPASFDEVMERYLGLSNASMLADLQARFAGRLPPDYLETLRARTREVFAAELRPIEGIAEVVRALPAPCCVASSGTPERIAHSLGLTGLLPLFQGRMFSATMVARGKPAPDLFLFAASRMGAAPQACVVVEDSVAGVTAAAAGGIRCIGFAGGAHIRPGHAERLLAAGADEVITRMSELLPLLSET